MNLLTKPGLEHILNFLGQVWICELVDAAPIRVCSPPEVPSINSDAMRRPPAIHQGLPCPAHPPRHVCRFFPPATESKSPPAPPRTSEVAIHFKPTFHRDREKQHNDGKQGKRHTVKWQARKHAHTGKRSHGDARSCPAFGPALTHIIRSIFPNPSCHVW